ncbi:MAG TPA: hypothetical protein VF677_12495 [Flavobacterium sp.]|jgi:hypothetical protein
MDKNITQLQDNFNADTLGLFISNIDELPSGEIEADITTGGIQVIGLLTYRLDNQFTITIIHGKPFIKLVDAVKALDTSNGYYTATYKNYQLTFTGLSEK